MGCNLCVVYVLVSESDLLAKYFSTVKELGWSCRCLSSYTDNICNIVHYKKSAPRFQVPLGVVHLESNGIPALFFLVDSFLCVK